MSSWFDRFTTNGVELVRSGNVSRAQRIENAECYDSDG